MIQTAKQSLNTGFSLLKSGFDHIEPNKVAGAGLLVVMSIWVIGMIGDVLVHPKPRKAPAVAAVGAGATPTAPKEEPKLELVGPLLAAADPAKGAQIFKKCRACHTSDKGAGKKIGPNLYNIVNAKQAHSADFDYSKAMREHGKIWTYEELNAFLKKPRSYIPGTKMAFAGIPKVSQRADLIAFLRSLSDSPAPLP